MLDSPAQRKHSSFFLTAVLFAALGSGQLRAETAPDVAAAQRRATELVRDAMAEDGGTGVQAVVLIDGREVWSAVLGHADLESGTPLAMTHRLRIGSVAKPITAMIALRLRDLGKFDIDASIRDLVPSFPDKGATITSRLIAAHASGIRQYDFNNFAEANNQRYYPELADALSVFATDLLFAPPGTTVEYSSLAFNLLGVAIEASAGDSFSHVLEEFVSRPLGLEATVIDHPLMIIPRRARFYTSSGGQATNTFWRDSSDYYPSGGLLSNARDLARFTDAVLRGDFLAQETRQLVSAPFRLNDGTIGKFSFGWEVDRRADGAIEWIGHGGEANGAHATARFYPAARMVVVGVTNYNVFGAPPRILQVLRSEIPELFRPLAGAASDPTAN